MVQDLRHFPARPDRTGQILGVIGIIGAMLLAYSCDYPTPRPAMQKSHTPAAIDLKEVEYAAFLQKYNHPTPVVAAKAVRKGARKEKVMLALVAQEGAGPRTKSRDGKGSIGLGQVTPRWHGQVSHDPATQIRQSEWILDQLVQDRKSLDKGLAAYNGSGPAARRYAEAVKVKLSELEQ